MKQSFCRMNTFWVSFPARLRLSGLIVKLEVNAFANIRQPASSVTSFV